MWVGMSLPAVKGSGDEAGLVPPEAVEKRRKTRKRADISRSSMRAEMETGESWGVW